MEFPWQLICCQCILNRLRWQVKDLSMSLIQRWICVHSLGFMGKAHIDFDCVAFGSLPCLTPSTGLSRACALPVPAFHPGRDYTAKLAGCPFLWMGELQQASPLCIWVAALTFPEKSRTPNHPWHQKAAIRDLYWFSGGTHLLCPHIQASAYLGVL